MSRCFPYPPPVFVRNPVAGAEVEMTAKLQKEREKAEKKKEKRSKRKALQQDETSKHSKHSHKKRKHGDISTVVQLPKTLSKESVEQLEKSGLSEEHGAPCFVQTVLHSPESSQDSSKRRKVVLPSPSQAKNGNILRIKIKRDQDSPRGVLEKPMFLEQLSVKQMVLGSSSLSKPNSIQHHNKVNVKSAAAANEMINVEPRAVQNQASRQLPSNFTRRDDSQLPRVVQQTESKLSVKPSVGRADLQPPRVVPLAKMPQRDLPGKTAPAKVLQRVDHPVLRDLPGKTAPATKLQRVDPQVPRGLPGKTAPAKVLQRVDPQVPRDLPGKPAPAKVLQRVDPQVPSAEIQRKLSPAFPKVSQVVSTSAIRQLQNQPPALVQNSKLEAPGINRQTALVQNSKLKAPGLNQIQRPSSSVLKEEPSSSGRNADAVQRQEAKQSKSDQKKSRKAEKKEMKFRDLFVTWNPPSFEMEDSDVGVQDWLFGSTRNSDVCTANCRASDGSVPFQSMEQQHSLQRMATFLPDLHLYQLPYVVPF